MRIAVCLYVKNEERDIAEWLAYQHVIGFDACLVYDNNSTDRTAAVLAEAGTVQPVIVTPWPLDDYTAQMQAYRHALATHGRHYDWIAFLDSDEFLLLHQDATVAGLVGRHPGAAAIAVNWALFGSSGIVDPPDALVIEAFTRRAPESRGTNRHFKTLARTESVSDILNAHMVETGGPYIRPDGSPLEVQVPGKTKADATFSVAQVNHYFLRSRWHWDRKVARGFNNLPPRTEAAFAHHDRNEVEDLGAADLGQRVRRQIARFPGGHLRD